MTIEAIWEPTSHCQPPDLSSAKAFLSKMVSLDTRPLTPTSFVVNVPLPLQDFTATNEDNLWMELHSHWFKIDQSEAYVESLLQHVTHNTELEFGDLPEMLFVTDLEQVDGLVEALL